MDKLNKEIKMQNTKTTAEEDLEEIIRLVKLIVSLPKLPLEEAVKLAINIKADECRNGYNLFDQALDIVAQTKAATSEDLLNFTNRALSSEFYTKYYKPTEEK